MTEASSPETALSSTAAAQPLPRLKSGIPGLDEILLGGFVLNGLYIIRGSPGAGKTIFGNQICYASVAAGGRAIYVTLLSEQHERMLGNLGQLSFFDASRIAKDITYVSAFQLLERDGLPGLLTLLRREIVAFKADVLVLDGLLASEAHDTSDFQLKKFVHELQMLAATCDCTMFLLTSGRGHLVSAETTMVDGLIELADTASGWRIERTLSVRKFRGSDHLAGSHAMRITHEGVTVWPRTEALLHSPARVIPGSGAARMSTGIGELDEMLRGGVPRASSTLVLGPTGTGKTLLGMHFLDAATDTEPGLLLGFYETPERIMARAEKMLPNLPALIRSGTVEIMWQSPSEDLIDRVGSELLSELKRRGVKRLVIDGLLGFRDMAVQPERMPMFYRAITNALRGLDVTVVCTMEAPELIGPIAKAPIDKLTPVAENLILLRYVEQQAKLERVLSIMKVRDSEFDHRLRNFEIGTGGMHLGPGFDGSTAILTGFADDGAHGTAAAASDASRAGPGKA